MFLYFLDELVGRNIDADIDDFETAAFEHGGHEVLADVVEVAFHGSDDHLADAAGGLSGHQWLQHFESGLHGATCHQQLRHESFTVLESLTNLRHGADHLPVDNVLRLRSFG